MYLKLSQLQTAQPLSIQQHCTSLNSQLVVVVGLGIDIYFIVNEFRAIACMYIHVQSSELEYIKLVEKLQAFANKRFRVQL